MKKYVRWTREMIQFFDEAIAAGNYTTSGLRAAMFERFGVMPSCVTIDQRVRAHGVRRYRNYAKRRAEFMEFAASRAGFGPYSLARMFNEKTGAGVTGQLCSYWMRRAAA